MSATRDARRSGAIGTFAGMRFVIVGVGAVGGTVAAELAIAGVEVLAVARGAHGAKIAADGLDYASPDHAHVVRLDVVPSLSEATLRPDDVVVIATKGHDTVGVLDELRRVAPDARVACLQNGIDNERQALRRFADVYGICVMLPGEHLEPGVVRCHATPAPGILDVGRYPHGTDETSDAIAAALRSARFASESRPDVMRSKARKLLSNLGNALDALLGPDQRAEVADLGKQLVAEGEAVYAAAGIDATTAAEDRERRGDIFRVKPIDGDGRRNGGSTFQSMHRGMPVETDYLTGEIVLLGRLHGVPTPLNSALQRMVVEAAAQGTPPGSLTPQELVARLADVTP